MYQYEDPPEVQTPEHRSVVFASLANLLTFGFIFWPCASLVSHYLKGWAGIWIEVGIPILVSAVILHLGCLWDAWPRLVRPVCLTVLSGGLLMAMLAYLLFITPVVLVCIGLFHEVAQQRICG